MFKLFSFAATDALAKELVKEIATRYPVKVANDPARSISPQRLGAILENVVLKAQQFVAEEKLGMMKKARLGTTFKWEMKELGYNDKFIEAVTRILVLQISTGPSAVKK
ncbi:MAG: hypothetical protein RIR00_1489 [Pseudomonadota bacterium]|jgi:hypothetical protein